MVQTKVFQIRATGGRGMQGGNVAIVRLRRDRFVVVFDDVFEGGQALAAFGIFAARAGAVGVANAGALAMICQMVFDLLVVKRVAEAYEHCGYSILGFLSCY